MMMIMMIMSMIMMMVVVVMMMIVRLLQLYGAPIPAQFSQVELHRQGYLLNYYAVVSINHQVLIQDMDVGVRYRAHYSVKNNPPQRTPEDSQ